MPDHVQGAATRTACGEAGTQEVTSPTPRARTRPSRRPESQAPPHPPAWAGEAAAWRRGPGAHPGAHRALRSGSFLLTVCSQLYLFANLNLLFKQGRFLYSTERNVLLDGKLMGFFNF